MSHFLLLTHCPPQANEETKSFESFRVLSSEVLSYFPFLYTLQTCINFSLVQFPICEYPVNTVIRLFLSSSLILIISDDHSNLGTDKSDGARKDAKDVPRPLSSPDVADNDISSVADSNSDVSTTVSIIYCQRSVSTELRLHRNGPSFVCADYIYTETIQKLLTFQRRPSFFQFCFSVLCDVEEDEIQHESSRRTEIDETRTAPHAA